MAQTRGDLLKHMARRLRGKQSQRDDQVDHELHVEFFLALFPGVTIAEHLLDSMRGDDRFQHVQPHLLAQLVIEGDLAYATRHEATPFCDNDDRFLQYVTNVASPYLNGIGVRTRCQIASRPHCMA